MKYIIKKGDTLSAISKKLNIPIKKLVEQNNIADPNKIYAGSKLKYNDTKKGYSGAALIIQKKEQGGEVVYNPRDKEFKEWYNRNTLEGQNNIPYSNELDYDYYSFYKNGEYKNRNYNIKKHFPDTYKRPNHKTFSKESIYSTKENPGGTWRGNIFIPPYQNGGEVTSEPTSEPTSDILFKLNEFKHSVPEYIYNGYINSGLDGLYKGIDKTKYDVVQRTLPDGTITYLPYTYSNVQDNSKNFNELQDKTYNKQIAVNKYNLGGGVSPYQIIQPSIYPQNYGINSPYFSQQPPLFDGQVGSPYYSTHDDYSQYGITNNRISKDLMQRDPLAKSTPSTSAKSIGSEVAGIGNGIGPDGKGGIMGNGIDPISIGAKAASATFDATNMLMQNLSKEDSATRGWADASIKASKYAGAVTDIVKDVPIVGPLAEAAGKSLSFWIAGPMGARSANIRKEEMKHATDLNEFNERNSQTVLAPNNYGNYMAEFGINTNTEINPLMEEILNDFRNYLAQIQNT